MSGLGGGLDDCRIDDLMASEQFAAYVKKEVDKWGAVIKEAKIPQIE